MVSMQFFNLASDVCNCLASMAIIIIIIIIIIIYWKKQLTNVHA